MTLRPAWQGQQERGSRTMIRTMVRIASWLGRPVARGLLYPICVYYLCFSLKARRAMRRFYERVCDRPATWMDLFRHYYAFASTILDRVYFLRGQFDQFDIQVHGLDDLDRTLAQQRGCVLLGSHLGSFEVVRAVGLSRTDVEISVLMDEQNAPLIQGLIRELSPEVAKTVIQIGCADSLFQVKESVERGGVVGIMGDRVVNEDRAIDCTFFGRPARFPTGALRLAHVVRAPIVLFFGLYRGQNRYEIHLESFSEQVRLSPEARDQDLARWTQRYATRLEAFARQAPDNWFNFYDFWHEAR